MSSSRKTALILSAFVAGAGVIAAVWYATSPPAADTHAPSVAPNAAGPRAAPTAKVDTPELGEPRDDGTLPSAPAKVATTVVWPVKIELELVRGTQMPTAKDVPAFRTGATARFSGRILRGETGVAAQVTFTAGMNLGRVLDCNADGEFGAIDLFPGIGEVHVTGPGIESVREVRLHSGGNSDEPLNISYGLPGEVWGTVFDHEAKGIAEVDVELDGQHTTTDENGVFHFETMNAGDALELILKKPGFATQWQRMGVPAGRVIAKGQKTYTMLPGASLEIGLGGRVGAKGDAQVILLPEQMNLERSYPWHRISPLALAPGTSRRLDDLPSTRIRVRVFHEGAIAEPEQSTVTLRAGETAALTVRLDPAPALNGIVMDREGRRIEDARVTFETPDRTATTLQYLGEMPVALESEIIPPIAPAVGEARSNAKGEFLLSSWPKFGKARYLSASTDDGSLFGAMVVPAGTKQVQLIVAPVTQGTATLNLDFTGRHQGLPVEASINGVPREPTVLATGDPMRLSGLATGTWRLRATWNGRSLLAAPFLDFDLTGDLTQSLETPAGAVQGQDADTRLRAGKQPASYVPSDFAPTKK
jgi:hypothetical protein